MQSTDDRVQAQIITRIERVVDGVLRRVLGSNDIEHDDLRQEAIQSVLTAFERGQFRGDCTFAGWAAAITRNIVFSALRSRSRSRQLFASDALRGELHDEDDDGHVLGAVDPRCPHRLVEIRHDLERVQRALIDLGPAKERIIYLHDALGYELEEVARMVGISVAAAQSRLVRARRDVIRSLKRD